ncbi:hypothetical protein EDB92DRAFT_1841625 [Lactarius akahatsu]|uniref:Uncharacterized protein n=1 Tax=Lactarius akahatsu TaxID=416441 RepID=A0AAD4LLI0_9AGAM|nr:hypothetical protein EDB92DRAFT_1841625 [Lactarius akahatsu]
MPCSSEIYICDELVLTLDDNIPTAGKGRGQKSFGHWRELIEGYRVGKYARSRNDATSDLSCYKSVFVGAPLVGRNRDYQTLNLNFAVNVLKFATIIRLLARIISDLPSQVGREMEFMRPMFKECLAKMEELGDEK